MNKIFAAFQGEAQELIPVLQAVQREFGCLSRENMQAIAKLLCVPKSRVYSVATFYAQFRFTPVGKHHCMVCRGTACHVKGAPRILEEIKNRLHVEEDQTSEDGEFSIETVACIGACGLAPTMVIGDKTYGKLTPKKVAEIVDEIKMQDKEKEHE